MIRAHTLGAPACPYLGKEGTGDAGNGKRGEDNAVDLRPVGPAEHLSHAIRGILLLTRRKKKP